MEEAFCLTRIKELFSCEEEIGILLDSLASLPEAFVCAGDFIAHCLWLYFSRHRARVPEGIAVTGYDDGGEFADAGGLLTTAGVKTELLGKRIAMQIIYRMEHGDAPYGRDIAGLSYDEYVGNIATVFQDFSLFAFSLAENVALSAKYDKKRVEETLARAALQEKTEKLPKGIRQAVSHDYEEDGVNLSGGEAQKLAIARAVYKDAGIVILDEPAAALDPYAEKEIYEQSFRHLAEETLC